MENVSFVSLTGTKWVQDFLKRHDADIGKRKPSMVNRAESQITMKDAEVWLTNMFEVVTEMPGCRNIFQEPWRIANADETQMRMDGESSLLTVFAARGAKRVYQEKAGTTETLTLMVSAAGDGYHFPPFIVVAGDPAKDPKDGKRLETHHIKDASYVYATHGWMDQPTFYKFILKLDEWITMRENQLRRERPQQNIKMRPFLLIMDGHGSHKGYPSSKFAKERDIILFILVPNATKQMQPLDVAYMKPLKQAWDTAVDNYQRSGINRAVTRKIFGRAYAEAHEVMVSKPEIVQSGFRTTGIYPFNHMEPYKHPERFAAEKGSEPIEELEEGMGVYRPIRKIRTVKPTLTADEKYEASVKFVADMLPPETPTERIMGLSVGVKYSKPRGGSDVRLIKFEEDTARDVLRAVVRAFLPFLSIYISQIIK